MVVIAIIGVLAAILWPVMSGVQEKARQAKCRTNLSQINTALRAYKTDYGRYPTAPWYDGTLSVYQGGASALWPDYVTSKENLRCPDDREWRNPNTPNNYSSYNGQIAATGPSSAAAYWAFGTTTDPAETNTSIVLRTVTYNYCGFSNSGWEDESYWDSVSGQYLPTRGASSGVPAWLAADGLKARHDPRLMNPRAPDNAVTFHCLHHRTYYGASDLTKWRDTLVRLGGESDTVMMSQWAHPKFAGPPSASQWKMQK
jgi:type II secretory pathway pseudopilin PulG